MLRDTQYPRCERGISLRFSAGDTAIFSSRVSGKSAETDKDLRFRVSAPRAGKKNVRNRIKSRRKLQKSAYDRLEKTEKSIDKFAGFCYSMVYVFTCVSLHPSERTALENNGLYRKSKGVMPHAQIY